MNVALIQCLNKLKSHTLSGTLELFDRLPEIYIIFGHKKISLEVTQCFLNPSCHHPLRESISDTCASREIETLMNSPMVSELFKIEVPNSLAILSGGKASWHSKKAIGEWLKEILFYFI